MAAMNPALEEQLRQGFKHLNKFMLLMWRLGLGGMLNAAPQVQGRYMVIVHTGRKSGITRYTPVNYAEVDGEVYCTAGFGHISDWYKNITANPNIEVWLPDCWWSATAEEVTGQEGSLRWMREVLIGSGAIVAPLMGLHPKTMTDVELAEATKEYRLLRIHRHDLKTGKGGPGELRWVWGIAFLMLIPVLWRMRRWQR